MATIRVNEFNTAEETATNGITNSNYGSADEANLTPADNAISPDTNSYEKWQKLEVTDMDGASKVDQLKVWRSSGTPTGDDSHVTNARETDYGGAETFATPTADTSTVATQTMPSSEPTDANLGIGGSLTGELTEEGSSDFHVHQIQVSAGTSAGASMQITYQARVTE